MPGPGFKGLLILAVAGEALRLFAMHWRRHLVLSVALMLPMQLLTLAGFFEPLMQLVAQSAELQAGAADQGVAQAQAGLPPLSGGLLLRILASMALFLLLTSAYATGWWWGLFGVAGHDAAAQRPWWEAYAAVLWKFVLFAGLMLGAGIALSLLAQIAGLALSPLDRAIGGGGVIAYLISLVFQIVLLGIGMRWAVALPSAVWGEDIPFAAAWRATRGQTATLTMIALLLGIPALMLSLILAQIFALGFGNAGALAAFVAGLLLSPVSFLVHGLLFAAMGCVFRRLRESGQI